MDDNKTDDNKTDDNKTDNKGNNSNSSNSQTNGQIDNTKASSVIPKAGITGKIILFAIVGLTCVIGISYIKYKNLNKIC